MKIQAPFLYVGYYKSVILAAFYRIVSILSRLFKRLFTG